MYVEFQNKHSKVKQEALERLCEELNKHGSLESIGLSFKKLVFSVREVYWNRPGWTSFEIK
jgi:hypothetical protein